MRWGEGGDVWSAAGGGGGGGGGIERTVEVDVGAVFVAIGHTPITSFLRDTPVEFNPDHPGS